MPKTREVRPLDEFRAELDRTNVISEQFKSHLITMAIWIAQDAYARGKQSE